MVEALRQRTLTEQFAFSYFVQASLTGNIMGRPAYPRSRTILEAIGVTVDSAGNALGHRLDTDMGTGDASAAARLELLAGPYRQLAASPVRNMAGDKPQLGGPAHELKGVLALQGPAPTLYLSGVVLERLQLHRSTPEALTVLRATVLEGVVAFMTAQASAASEAAWAAASGAGRAAPLAEPLPAGSGRIDMVAAVPA